MTDTAGIPEKRIAANLITGFLGAGKTSALLSLLPHRPRHERWAILVNEYGMVSLDHILLDESNQNAESGVDVDELAGGCFCCSLSMALPFALSRLIRRTKPHRIFLEPTGSGHPAAVIDLLRTGRFAEMLDLRTTICLVDPRDYLNPRITNSTVFQDQIQMADVVAINFTDKCDPEQIRRCREFVLAQDPPKLAVAETTHGKLNPEWLDMSGIVIRPPLFANSHHSPLDHPTAPVSVDLSPPLVAGPVSNDLQTLPLTELSAPQVLEQREPLPSRPLRLENQGLEQFACGWIFSPNDVFLREPLQELLESLQPVLRLKGVFHCQDDWWTIQRRGTDMQMQRSAYRRDSRVEVITDSSRLSWNDMESQLLACLRT